MGLVGMDLIRGQRTRQYPAAREPAYRPPPRPLSRSSSRNIETTLPGSRVEGAAGPPREPKGAPPPGLPREPKGAPPPGLPREPKGAPPPGLPREPKGAPPPGLRSDEGATREGGGSRAPGGERDNRASGTTERAGQQSEYSLAQAPRAGLA